MENLNPKKENTVGVLVLNERLRQARLPALRERVAELRELESPTADDSAAEFQKKAAAFIAGVDKVLAALDEMLGAVTRLPDYPDENDDGEKQQG